MSESALSTAKELFYKKEYKKASDIFLKENKLYEAGFCHFLMNDLENAKKYWQQDKKNLFASGWGLNALDYIKHNVKNYPSFLQIRAFYEIYIGLLIESNLIEYAQNLINVSHELAKANPEVPKFLARVLNAYGYDDLSLEFVKRIRDFGYMDPEALFISSEIYFRRSEYSNALDDLKRILDVLPEYYPAVKLKQIILDTYK